MSQDAICIMTLMWETAKKHDIDVISALQHRDVTSRVPESARDVWIDIWMQLLTSPKAVAQLPPGKGVAATTRKMEYPDNLQISCNKDPEQPRSISENNTNASAQSIVARSRSRSHSSNSNTELSSKARASVSIEEQEGVALPVLKDEASAGPPAESNSYHRQFSKESNATSSPLTRQRTLSKESSDSRRAETFKRPRSLLGASNELGSEKMWDDYLRHFSVYDLNWLSDAFDALQPINGCVPLESAVMITTTLVSDAFHCEQAEMDQQDAYDLLGTIMACEPEVATLSFKTFLAFVAAAQDKILKDDPQAGYSYQEALELKSTFKAHLRGDANALKTQDIFDLMKSMNQEPGSHELQQKIRQLIHEVDVDRSGTIDLQEFFHFMRKVEQAKDVRERAREHLLIGESKFSQDEIQRFQELFNKYSEESEDGSFSFRDLTDILSGLSQIIVSSGHLSEGSIEITPDLKKELAGHLREVMGIGREVMKVGQTLNDISFGEFLLLFRRLVDTDFASMGMYVLRLVLERTAEAAEL